MKAYDPSLGGQCRPSYESMTPLWEDTLHYHAGLRPLFGRTPYVTMQAYDLTPYHAGLRPLFGRTPYVTMQAYDPSLGGHLMKAYDPSLGGHLTLPCRLTTPLWEDTSGLRPLCGRTPYVTMQAYDPSLGGHFTPLFRTLYVTMQAYDQITNILLKRTLAYNTSRE